MAALSSGMECDLLIIGGGINGAGIARDAAGRGLRVVLCEQHDLAAHTSSASTKLIHGGLRYLEYYEFSLVRKALAEREVLLAAAPHILWPLRFVLPHEPHLRPAWMIRAGLFLYDHLARRKRLPGSRRVRLARHPAGEPLRPEFTTGFVYSDVWVDDARLVVLNAMDAAARGASILTRTRCTRLQRRPGNREAISDAAASAVVAGPHWVATLLTAEGGETEVLARAVVNAAGPWAQRFVEQAFHAEPETQLRLVKGSHVIVPKLFDHDYAYIFQNSDRRIVFAIPYEQDFTLIGTTDVDYRGDPAQVAIDADEVAYLCALATKYFRREVRPEHVVHTYSGVRPLMGSEEDEAAGVTRDYHLALDAAGAPLLNVIGGKITTYRRLAEDALEQLAPTFPAAAAPWTAHVPLPGGDLPQGDIEAWRRGLRARFPQLPASVTDRWARSYGTRFPVAPPAAGGAGEYGLGEEVLPGLYAAEVDYLWRNEWARTAEDILWRRSKLGLHLPRGSEDTLAAWLARRRA
jgi:glycerol-3-phosphate dehydrogenase